MDVCLNRTFVPLVSEGIEISFKKKTQRDS